jgi:hypothetical protein
VVVVAEEIVRWALVVADDSTRPWLRGTATQCGVVWNVITLPAGQPHLVDRRRFVMMLGGVR